MRELVMFAGFFALVGLVVFLFYEPATPSTPPPAEAPIHPEPERWETLIPYEQDYFRSSSDVRLIKYCDSVLPIGLGTFHRRVIYVATTPSGSVAMQIAEPHHTECRE